MGEKSLCRQIEVVCTELDPHCLMAPIYRLIAPVVITALFLAKTPLSDTRVAPLEVSSPVPDVLITMREYTFELDSTLSAGPHVIAIHNAGHQAHLVLLTRLSPGSTRRDVVSWLEQKAGAAPGEVIVASPEVKPHDSTTVTVNLTPGRYSLVCTVRGWWNRPHYKSGMARDIVVS